ncbi:MAG TPA: hypothetical protein VNE41_00845 [Chitinophagaceae bacterium]|nr:hypothetical protein [Chitinophagaceae bacterium]
MKKLIMILILAISGREFYSQPAAAQLRVHFQVNAGFEHYGVREGYGYPEYYYIPALDIYCTVDRHFYIYLSQGQWLFSPYLPGVYGNFDFDHCYKVLVNAPSPWLNDHYYALQYSMYRYRNGYNRWNNPYLRGGRDRYDHRNGYEGRIYPIAPREQFHREYDNRQRVFRYRENSGSRNDHSSRSFNREGHRGDRRDR